MSGNTRTTLLFVFVCLVCLVHNNKVNAQQQEPATPFLPIRFIHAVLDGPNCDVWINSQIVFANVSAATVTPFYDPGVALPMNSNTDDAGVLVEMYHTGTTKSYFDQALVGVYFIDTPAKRGFNATTSVVGSFTNNRKGMQPYGGQTYTTPSPSLALFRSQFLSPLHTDKLNIQLNFWSGFSWVSKIGLDVSPQENEPYSLVFPGVYYVNVSDVVTGNYLWGANLTFVAGLSYTVLAMGSPSAQASASTPLMIRVLTDEIMPTQPQTPTPVPNPPTIPTPTPIWNPSMPPPQPPTACPNVACACTTSESAFSRVPAYWPFVTFVGGVLLTYYAMKRHQSRQQVSIEQLQQSYAVLSGKL